MTAHEPLYGLLPSLYRRRDAELGYPLRALLAVIDAEFEKVRADIETTWDNWFVETAEEWLVPYLGELLGVPTTRDVQAIAFSRRALVANTLGYRRRKGTAAMLEQLARDLTNYPTRVVELFERLAVTEAVNHPTGRPATVDLRSTSALSRIGGPFEEASRSVDVRRIATGRGLHNLPNVGLFMWRTRVVALRGANAARLAAPSASAWRFSPLGAPERPRPLYAPLETETDAAALATEASVPLALGRRRLWARAAELRAADRWPFAITVRGRNAQGLVELRPVPAARIDVCDLSNQDLATLSAPAADQVEVDPEFGRLSLGASFTTGLSEVEVLTDHFTAAAGDLGAGPWDRDEAAQAWLARWTSVPEARSVGLQLLVQRDAAGPHVVPTLEAAIQAWNAHLNGLPDDLARSRALGLILVGDSRSHTAPASTLEMPAGAVLGLFAATWPATPAPAGGTERLKGRLLAEGVRPVVLGDLDVRGVATNGENRGELAVGGLAFTGSVRVGAGALQGLRLLSSTVLGTPAIDVDTGSAANAGLELALERSVVGELRAPGALGRIELVDSALTSALDAPRSPAIVHGSTVLGVTNLVRLHATNALFCDTVTVEEHQEGCLRFCYVEADSRVPRRFRCQPDLALEGVEGDVARAELVRLRVQPRFVSIDPLQPGFLLLAPSCPPEILGAAEDGGEPGSWHHLQHGMRLANLRNALPQFLRFGLETGFTFLV